MILKKKYYPFLMVVMILLPLLFLGFQGCGNGDSHSHSTEGEIRPEGVVVARFVEFRGPSPSGMYEMDIEIVKSQDIDGTENPTKDMVGKTITVWTQEYSEAILPGEVLAAYVGLYGEKGEAVLFARGLHPAVIEEK